MRQTDLNKVVFYSKEDGASGQLLQKGEHILRTDSKSNFTDINEILELYNIKKYIDNEVYLRSWTEDDIKQFKQKAVEYGKVVGKFMSTIDDNNILILYAKVFREYIHSFWELVSNQNVFKFISKSNFSAILTNEPHVIHVILTHKNLVDYYDKEIKDFLLIYSKSAEILLSVYEVKDDFGKNNRYIPKSLTVEDKESILSNYLDSNDVNYNYIEIIQNARNRNDFKVSDKTRLKAKRLHKSETETFFTENNGMKYGVSVSFPPNASKIKDGTIDDNSVMNYSYSLDFIKQHHDPYSLFQNFKWLFEYLDPQHRINLVSKKNRMGVLESVMGVHSQNKYRGGIEFNLLEMTSYIQIVGYNKVLSDSGISLENVLHEVFTSSFQEKYDFANNARFSIPSSTSYFEKVRLLAPEFESVLKQFKLCVEDGFIDFELLQISSTPTAIKDIPSLNKNKYIYFNGDNKEVMGCANLFFSDQSSLAYVEQFKEKRYHTFFDLLANERVNNIGFADYQKPSLNFLIDKGLITIDSESFVHVANPARVVILKDLHFNEVASFHHYSLELRQRLKRWRPKKLSSLIARCFPNPNKHTSITFLIKANLLMV